MAKLEQDINKYTESLLELPKSSWAGIGQKIETATMQKTDIEIDLAKLRVANKIRYTEKEITAWLKLFCKGDLFDMKFRRRIIDTFINSIFIYDDRIIIFYNIRGGKQISYLDMLDATKGAPNFDIPDAEKGMESIRILNDSVKVTRRCLRRCIWPHLKQRKNGRCQLGIGGKFMGNYPSCTKDACLSNTNQLACQG